jgi:hypothetical protein
MNKLALRAASVVLPMLGLCAPTATADTTVNLFQHDTVQHQVDLEKPGPGPGDQFIFAGDVFDRPGGVWLGTGGGSCTTLSANKSACSGTFNLAGGQLVVQAVTDNAALTTSGAPMPVSVVGGTGIYQNARGTGTIQVPPEVPNQTDANIVLNLTSG